MEVCHPAWSRRPRGLRPRWRRKGVPSRLRTGLFCLEHVNSLTASADAAPVEMWTTLFALSTSPQADAAMLAAVLPTGMLGCCGMYRPQRVHR